MTPHVDILEESDSLRNPFMASMVLHGSIVLVLTLNPSMIGGRAPEHWGDPNAGGGAVSVKPVAGIPLPAREGAVNPVANDTQSQVPAAPPKPKPVERAKAPDPNAIPLKGKKEKKTQSEVIASRQRYRPQTEQSPNQLYSSSGQALRSPMIGTPGGGGVGIGTGSPLGDRFGAYARLLQQLVAQKWNTADLDPRIRTAPPVIVHFTIMRDGTIKDVKIEKSSGNLALDLSAQRAIADVGRAPELPPAYERNEARIEFWFELKR